MITLATGKWVAWDGRSPLKEGIYEIIFISKDGAICRAVAEYKGRELWISHCDGTYLAWKEIE